MSQLLELPDALYAALKKAAAESGTTPVEWIAAHLPNAEEAQSASAPKTLADLLAGHIGGIRSSGEQRWSENCGDKFTDYLRQKKAAGRL